MNTLRADVDDADTLARVKLSRAIEPGDLRVTDLVSELGAVKVRLPDMVDAACAQLPPVVDGELVVWSAGRLDFAALAPRGRERIRTRRHRMRILAASPMRRSTDDHRPPRP